MASYESELDEIQGRERNVIIVFSKPQTAPRNKKGGGWHERRIQQREKLDKSKMLETNTVSKKKTMKSLNNIIDQKRTKNS